MTEYLAGLPNVSGHARERLLERYGLNATAEEWCVVVAGIPGRGLLLSDQKNGNTQVWMVEMRGLLVRLVYSTRTRSVVTVLAKNARLRRTRPWYAL